MATVRTKFKVIAIRKGEHYDGVSPVWNYLMAAVSPTGGSNPEDDGYAEDFPSGSFTLDSLEEREWDVFDTVYIDIVVPEP